ncbi:flagellar hook-length control protein FliK [Sphingobium sp. CAP-1]|uniref:flagellar hook-length control protein FliK n=1 Tax=Sphingobium sp. CAP-1 TaxID=2676077 RepID=UPI0012BB2940|nr:flagellar hook-length control protein FliK [Sphingobium sp. CAP-1]QGP79952.1 flagellar hook-length control protein FliK [Sphingobium sp. CAP-1]
MTMLTSIREMLSPAARKGASQGAQASAGGAAGFAKAMQAANAEPAEGEASSGVVPVASAAEQGEAGTGQGVAAALAARPDAIQRSDGGKGPSADAEGDAVPAPAGGAGMATQGSADGPAAGAVQPADKPAGTVAASGKAPARAEATDDEPVDKEDATDRDDDRVTITADASPPAAIIPTPPAGQPPRQVEAEATKNAAAGRSAGADGQAAAAANPLAGDSGAQNMAEAATAFATLLAGDPAQAAKAVRAEAASLLQLARDHVHAGVASGTDGATRDDASAPASDGMATTVASIGAQPQGMAPVLTAGATLQPAIAQGNAMPTVDLSASLGDQVVDMGVSGQWIDGLARDIAGLSANGAQGRFQINTDQLGQVQVDIRQGSDGAAVSLTVASAAAELALRQDSDRLKLDASLSAVRISDVKVERAPQIAEAARSDSAGNQGSSQQSQNNGWQGQGNGQGMGHSSAQSQMRGRGQARENIVSDLKGSSVTVVLNHEQTGEAGVDLLRARYA